MLDDKLINVLPPYPKEILGTTGVNCVDEMWVINTSPHLCLSEGTILHLMWDGKKWACSNYPELEIYFGKEGV